MATELRLPDLGEGIADADVLSVLVSAGQAVAKDDPIIEIESDKATLEVPAEIAGTVTQILVNAGDTLQVGQTILELEESASAADGKPVATPPPAKASAGTFTDAPAPTPAPAPHHRDLNLNQPPRRALRHLRHHRLAATGPYLHHRQPAASHAKSVSTFGKSQAPARADAYQLTT